MAKNSSGKKAKIGFSNSLSLPFQSYQGFRRLLVEGSEMRYYLKDIIEWAKEEGFGKIPEEKIDGLGSDQRNAFKVHQSIRILDTFFSDNLEPQDIKELVLEAHQRKGSSRYEFDIRILILDPYQSLARIRADSLPNSKNPHEEIVQSLVYICEALQEADRSRPRHDGESLTNLLSYVHSWGPHSNLFLRFYNILTEAPVYIVSQFALKGLILEGDSSERKPWMVFVDDIFQTEDIYDQYSNNFDLIFGELTYNKKNKIRIDDNNCRIFGESRLSWKWPVPFRSLDSIAESIEVGRIPETKSIHDKLMLGQIEDAIKEYFLLVQKNLKDKELILEAELLLATFQANEIEWVKVGRKNEFIRTERNRVIHSLLMYLQAYEINQLEDTKKD